MSEFTVRPATLADLPAVLDILNEAIRNTTASYEYEPRTLESRIEWFQDHQRDGYPVFVAVAADGQVVGWSSLSRYHQRFGYRFTAENSVYVAAGRRGRGVGKLLLPPLLEAARTMGLHAIIAVIDSQNATSIKLHHRLGFRQVGLFKEVGFKFGRWLDIVYMELLLEPPPSRQST
jgi:phosphinothricin acetyltransferase